MFIFVLHLVVAAGMAALGIPLILKWVPPNHWYGARTPSTLADASIWYPVNQLTGWWLVAGGVLLTVSNVITFGLRMGIDAAAWTNLVVLAACLAPMVAHILVAISRLKRERAQAHEAR